MRVRVRVRVTVRVRVRVRAVDSSSALRSWTALSKLASDLSPAVRSVAMYPGQTW